ncbi:hypothetical protein [Sphingobium cupriresistens]|uniref:Uncharacterized protein n=1 Tax=Sphingobium cupriresistens TaxID=1132417 RepID=A0A8G1ZGH8_9SPHN|nr:hypothetical protein [Sphingobium cupriresistens]RYM09631.1 hypothetical protein EWH12_13655 [Sphingobium cupriresistens]
MAEPLEFDPFDTVSKLNHIRKWLEQMAADCFSTKPDLLFDVFCVVWEDHPDMLPQFLDDIEFLRSIPETEAEADERFAAIVKEFGPRSNLDRP